ncbi:MAG: transposase [Gemmatimonadales bacterium]
MRHRRRPGLAGPRPCHVTLKVREGVPSLRSARFVREIERSFARACERGRFRVVHYSIQHDHAHLMVEARDSEALGRGMKAIAARFARAVNRVFGRSGRVLRDRDHLHVLETPREVRNALLLNGRRHAAKSRGGASLGTVRIDPASSGAWFDGWRAGVARLLQGRAVGPPPVARARTWLLRRGWRRHGLLDPSEVPGPRRPRG